MEVILAAIFVLLFFGLGVFLYFLPAFVAFRREHHNRMAILMLNIFLGWTFLGWVGALIWSFTAVRYAEDEP